jgi:hypothetical protein
MGHKLLVGVMTRVSELESERQRQQLSAIPEFTPDIQYVTFHFQAFSKLWRTVAANGLAGFQGPFFTEML